MYFVEAPSTMNEMLMPIIYLTQVIIQDLSVGLLAQFYLEHIIIIWLPIY